MDAVVVVVVVAVVVVEDEKRKMFLSLPRHYPRRPRRGGNCGGSGSDSFGFAVENLVDEPFENLVDELFEKLKKKS